MQIAYTDQELLALIAQKNERALTLLHSRYYRQLCATAYKKLADECVVEEIVQDVFVAVWNKADQLQADGDLKNYLFAILRNKILYEMRLRMSKASLMEFYQATDEISNINAADLLQAKELEQRLHAVIEELSPQSRQAFKLSRFEQMPYKKIAEHLNVSVGTVEKHISKALSVLRKEFSEADNLFLLTLAIYLLKNK